MESRCAPTDPAGVPHPSRRRRPRPARRPPRPELRRAPIVEMRDIRVVVRRRPCGRRRLGRPPPGRGRSGSSAATAPASRRSCASCRAPNAPIPARSSSMAQPVSISNPRDAKALGIETIYQTLALADNVDAAANVFLGRELQTRVGQPGRRRDGIGHAQGHGPAQPALPELQDAGPVAVRRSAPGASRSRARSISTPRS